MDDKPSTRPTLNINRKIRGQVGAWERESTATGPGLALCLSHLRWDFVYQRPQHLMSRLANHMPVVYVEEPKPTDAAPWLEERHPLPNLTVAIPHLPPRACGPGNAEGAALQRDMLDQLVRQRGVARPLLWYYTPMALDFSDHVDASLVVYDCMDELSGFRFAPPQLLEREQQLLESSAVVFTGGRKLYEAKRQRHRNVHAYPSGVDVAHFARARTTTGEPPDQQALARPRIGYYGVIDERLDYPLIAAAAALRPDYQWIFVGPLAKVDPAELPRARNLHFLGPKSYDELPEYLGGWDVAMMPFALNEATTYISPTKTPEYLAGGRPVISTPIEDVVRSYGDCGLVTVAADAEAFVAAADAWIRRPLHASEFSLRADALLSAMAWDGVFSGMHDEIQRALEAAPAVRAPLMAGA
jgi:UDP-galactopyranose mutase